MTGGGISGLTAAFRLRRALGSDAEIVVYEKSAAVGGHLRVSEVAGVPVDEGAESLLARRPEAVELVREVGLADEVVHPAGVGAGLWLSGRIVALPSGTVMGVPDNPARLSDVLSPAEAEHAAETDRRAGGMPVDGDVSIGRLVRSRFGAAVADRLVDPLLGGVYAGHADELSLDATVPALGAAARTHTSLGAAVADVRGSAAQAPSGPVFAGVRGGVGRLPDVVAAASGAVIRTGVTVREIERTASGWRLVTGPVPSPEADDVDGVVVALPAAPAARLLRAVVPLAAAELADIDAASMAIVTLALPRSAFPAAPDSTGFLVPATEGRLVKAVTYSSVKWPWLGERAGELVVLRASVGRHREVSELQRDDADLVAAVLDDLREAVGVSGRPVGTRVTRWGGALPQYSVGHVERVGRIRAAVEAAPGLAVCGAVYDGVGIAACVATAGMAASRVADHLTRPHARIEP